MTTYRHRRVVLGLATEDLDTAADAVRQTLSIALRPRESSHYGGDYYRGDTTPPEDVRLYRNVDPVDGTSHHGDAGRTPVILRVMGTDRDPDDLAQQLRVELGADVAVLEVS